MSVPWRLVENRSTVSCGLKITGKNKSKEDARTQDRKIDNLNMLNSSMKLIRKKIQTWIFAEQETLFFLSNRGEKIFGIKWTVPQGSVGYYDKIKHVIRVPENDFDTKTYLKESCWKPKLLKNQKSSQR